MTAFHVALTLDNLAVHEGEDAPALLRKLADRLEAHAVAGKPLGRGESDTGVVLDWNGNRVGLWRYVGDEPQLPQALVPVDDDWAERFPYLASIVNVPADVQRRMTVAMGDVLLEARRSVTKHGDQAHLPMGTGPDSEPLAFVEGLPAVRLASGTLLANLATAFTKSRSHNEGGNGAVTWWDVLLEEVMEASAESDPALLRKELVQVAAVAVKMVEALDRAEEAGS